VPPTRRNGRRASRPPLRTESPIVSIARLLPRTVRVYSDSTGAGQTSPQCPPGAAR
jgi:hypothetical protein